jgi:putative membrane protein
MSLLSEDDSKALSRAIEVVEHTTAGEIVVAVVPRSDDYAYPRALLAMVGAVGTGWVLYSAFPTVPSAFVFAGQVVLWVIFWWLSTWAWLVRKMVPRAQLVAAVDAKAKQTFLEQGLMETVDRSGVLIFVSELEHRVQILADRGIHERVDSQMWQQHVRGVIDAIRAGRAADGLQKAIADIGVSLAALFPPRADNTNELPNEVVRYR